MMLLVVHIVMILNLSRTCYGLSIKSEPSKVSNGEVVKLTCSIGNIDKKVEWRYGGVTYFSCEPPYTACYTNTNVPKHTVYKFDVLVNNLTVVLAVIKDQNDGIWTCYHGSEKAEINIDNGDSPKIKRCSDYRFEFSGSVPADIVIYARNYRGTRVVYTANQTTSLSHRPTMKFECSDSKLICNVTNDYGPTVTDDYHIFLHPYGSECPLKILRNLTKSIFYFSEKRNRIQVPIYYESGERVTVKVVRFTKNNREEFTGTINNYHYDFSDRNEPSHSTIYFQNLRESDADTYYAILKQEYYRSSEEELPNYIAFKLVYSHSSATTVVMPFHSSTGGQSSLESNLASTTIGEYNNTKQKGNQKNDNKNGLVKQDKNDEKLVNQDNNYGILGITGFVISIILVVILVIFMVIAFIWLKRKRPDQSPSNQVYVNQEMIDVNTNAPHVYEHLNRF